MRFLIILGILLGGCCRSGEQCDTPPPKPPVYDSGSTDPCDNACAKMRAMGCKEGNPTPSGVTCEDFCKSLRENSPVRLNPECIVEKANSCAQIRSCASD